MKKVLYILCVLVILAGCTQTIEEVTKDDSFVGETVAVRGTVASSLKLGDLSGYTLVDKNNDAILVGSKSLPAEGSTVTAKGTLQKGPLGIGYYITTE